MCHTVTFYSKEFGVCRTKCHKDDNPKIMDKLYIQRDHTLGTSEDKEVFGGWHSNMICIQEKDSDGMIEAVHIDDGIIT